jgi:plastocyanin
MSSTIFNITTTSAKEEAFFYITATTSSASVLVKWGDNTRPQSIDLIKKYVDDTTDLVSSKFTHTYDKAGEYNIELIVTDGTIGIYRYGATSSDIAVSSNVTGITIGPRITMIGDHAFEGLNVSEIECIPSTPPTLGTDALGSISSIKVQEYLVDVYKDAWPDRVNDISKIVIPTHETPLPEHALSGEAFMAIIAEYGDRIKFIKTENNVIAVNQRWNTGPFITTDEISVKTFGGYDFIECRSYDAYFRHDYISLIRVNDIRTFVIAIDPNDRIDAFRC